MALVFATSTRARGAIAPSDSELAAGASSIARQGGISIFPRATALVAMSITIGGSLSPVNAVHEAS